MNLQIIKRINNYRLSPNSEFEKIKEFLSVGILNSELSLINGETLDEKAETIYNYLNNVVKEPEVKQPLNIVIADDSSSLEYVSYLNEKYEVIVHKSQDVKNPKDIDLVLFTGGEDVNPAQYGQNIGKYTSVNNNRDNKEIETFHKFSGGSLLLGICRGNQLLTVLSGGKLIQHVEGHGRDHNMILNSGMRYKITSSHHQMIYPFDLNEKDYELIAYSEYFQSNTYLNGDNEEIEVSKNFLEPEIVYYKNTNSLCIQGHPEWSHCDKRTSTMCLYLIDKYLKNFREDGKSINPKYYKTNIFDPVMVDHYEDDNNDEENDNWESEEQEVDEL